MEKKVVFEHSRVFNFSPGPAMLPQPVIETMQRELLDWHGTGISAMEFSHRSPEFIGIAHAAEAGLRRVLSVPETHRIVFMHGGSRGQFAAIPMNVLGPYDTAGYLVTGMWGALAYSEANQYCAPTLLFDGAETGYTQLPTATAYSVAMDQCAYVHYVDNETVHGIEFTAPPAIDSSVPLIADMSSNLLTKPVDFSKFAMVYACAQKNIGPAGITIAIIREDLLARAPIKQTPSILNYQMQVKKESMVNTPATYPWYVVGLMADWVSSAGGVSVMHERALARSSQLYAYIDQSDFYYNKVDPAVRSRINVVFKLRDEALNTAFLKEAEALGLSGLKGHRATGGMRASMYNAMPQVGSDKLLAHMQAFEARHR